MHRKYKTIILVVLWFFSLVFVYAYAQRQRRVYRAYDVLTVENSSKVVFENARVRVQDNIFQPSVKPPMHTHELDHVGVIIEGGTLQFNYPDGKSETLKLETGSVGWRDKDTTHQAINLGNKPVRVIEVELK